MPAVDVRDLRKAYDATKALDGVSLTVREGELFGLIGPDGAGKTTLFRILVTLLKPDTGSATVDGLDVVEDLRKLRPRLGYMPGRFSLYQDLTVEENLSFFAAVFGTSVDENYDWIRPVYERLEPFRSRRAGALSGGMKQKLALSCALIHRPNVLILDEPTTGVDAVSRKEFWENLDAIKQSGVTTLMSTPYMDEAARCDRVALIQDGRLLDTDRPSAIAKNFEHALLGITGERRNELLKALRRHPAARSAYPFGASIHFAAPRDRVDADGLRAYLTAEGFMDVGIEPIEAGIEDVFIDRMAKE